MTHEDGTTVILHNYFLQTRDDAMPISFEEGEKFEVSGKGEIKELLEIYQSVWDAPQA